ncbi:hypothetical protein [Flavobacterium piscis]|jgi:hypothetical protein|uniref:hypothetical protein n=1 Tax=Flavobacterium piscis TaxID=1114874 RepID=UPI0013F4CCDF|nr:hypothetical protein [Flavobacterium piscis]
MKKLILLGACALLTTMISCTADDFEDTKTKPEIPAYADGPGDSPIVVPPPPPPKQ